MQLLLHFGFTAWIYFASSDLPCKHPCPTDKIQFYNTLITDIYIYIIKWFFLLVFDLSPQSLKIIIWDQKQKFWHHWNTHTHTHTHTHTQSPTTLKCNSHHLCLVTLQHNGNISHCTQVKTVFTAKFNFSMFICFLIHTQTTDSSYSSKWCPIIQPAWWG